MGDGNDATSLRPFDDEMIIVNMSVWQNLERLKDYVYKSAHTDILKRRAEWFEKLQDIIVVLWWIPAGHEPTVQEAKERLEHLQRHGSSHILPFPSAKPFLRQQKPEFQRLVLVFPCFRCFS